MNRGRDIRGIPDGALITRETAGSSNGLLFFILFLLLILQSFVVSPSFALTDEEGINIRVFREASPSVVNITTTTLVRDFFSIYPQKGAGSGSIIDSSGYILTNFHVIEDASEINVTLNDGRRFPARFVGADPENDIAVIKIQADRQLKPLKLGDSDELQVGQKVFAIGNPFGLNSTLTTGIISALGRPLTTETGRRIDNVIQTDAPINPGNSGGPLLDTEGRLIGMNTAIFSPSGGNVGIGFAIPSSVVREIVPDLIKYGKVRRPWLGIVGVPLWPGLARALELTVERGILVSEVDPEGPAARAGIRGGNLPVRISGTLIYLGGDVIVEINGKPVNSMEDIKSALRGKREGERVKILISRRGKLRTVKMKVRLRG